MPRPATARRRWCLEAPPAVRQRAAVFSQRLDAMGKMASPDCCDTDEAHRLISGPPALKNMPFVSPSAPDLTQLGAGLWPAGGPRVVSHCCLRSICVAMLNFKGGERGTGLRFYAPYGVLTHSTEAQSPSHGTP
ncbi:hypothetical protein SKAU_G00387920 [Synaphobranchus kaupii]|uniref:Uncharacterized protein n=1 Tax=Synaphobranchus kaupii TaxID=118154 RepID=A0A9Q1EB06_SYNKA|nr:hypothetical protein SKAU_G00387920 [Synaphobranchus kaupii]